ncbi:hypothetical protein CF70_017820 [Cupriavidus sp. SK-3]|nr:hypothetical protein CF70_017820 [Cupriavidus sp. SK-3]
MQILLLLLQGVGRRTLRIIRRVVGPLPGLRVALDLEAKLNPINQAHHPLRQDLRRRPPVLRQSHRQQSVLQTQGR